MQCKSVHVTIIAEVWGLCTRTATRGTLHLPQRLKAPWRPVRLCLSVSGPHHTDCLSAQWDSPLLFCLPSYFSGCLSAPFYDLPAALLGCKSVCVLLCAPCRTNWLTDCLSVSVCPIWRTLLTLFLLPFSDVLSRGMPMCSNKDELRLTGGWWDRRTGRWVGVLWGRVGLEKEGDLFSHDLVFLAGPASNPLAAPPPRRALSATRLAVRASLGHSGIPLRHSPYPPPPPAGCLLPSEDFHPCCDAPS